MNVSFFDIETIANSSMVNRLPAIEVRAGNLKDPAKIKEKEEAARAEQREKMTLNPLYGRVCAFVVIRDNITTARCITEESDDAEIDIIEAAFSALANSKIVTYNGNGFDLPFLYRRACLLGINPRSFGLPVLADMTARYHNDRHVDLMQVWCGVGGGAYEKLDNLARVLVDDAKIEIDFHDFPELIKTPEGRSELLAYCEQDVALTEKIYFRFAGVLF